MDVGLVAALVTSVAAMVSSAWFVLHEGVDDASVDRIRAGIEAELHAGCERAAAARLRAGMAAEAAGVERVSQADVDRYADRLPAEMTPQQPRGRSSQDELNHGLVAAYFAGVVQRRRRQATRVLAAVTIWAATVHAVGAFWLPSAVVKVMALDMVVLVAALFWWWWWRGVVPGVYGEEWACFVEGGFCEEVYIDRVGSRDSARRDAFLAEFGAALAVSDFPDLSDPPGGDFT